MFPRRRSARRRLIDSYQHSLLHRSVRFPPAWSIPSPLSGWKLVARSDPFTIEAITAISPRGDFTLVVDRAE